MEIRPEKSSRRVVLKRLLMSTSVAVGVTIGMIPLPDNWVKPVVDVVLVPAHAQTSPLATYFGINLPVEGPIPGGPDTISVCVEIYDDTAIVVTQSVENQFRRQGNIPTDGTPGDLEGIAISQSCQEEGQDAELFTAHISDLTTVSVKVYISETPDAPDYSVTVPAVSACGEFPLLDGECVPSF